MRANGIAMMVAGSLFIAAAHAAAPGPALRSPPTVTGGSCGFKNTEVAVAASFDQSTSTSFVKLKDAGSINFTESQTGCVAGSFFANAGNGDEGDHVLLQILLDGAPCAPLSAGYIFANSGPDFSSHSTGFFCGAHVTPGQHRVEVEYASGLGGTAEIFQRTLQVSHQ